MYVTNVLEGKIQHVVNNVNDLDLSMSVCKYVERTEKVIHSHCCSFQVSLLPQ